MRLEKLEEHFKETDEWKVENIQSLAYNNHMSNIPCYQLKIKLYINVKSKV